VPQDLQFAFPGLSSPNDHSDLREKARPEGAPVTDVVILCWTTPQESDRRAQEIATFLGAGVRFFAITSSTLNEITVPRCSCLIVDAETLAKIAAATPNGTGDLPKFLEAAGHVLVYGFEPAAAHDAVLQALSSEAFVNTRALSGSDVKLKVAAHHPEWCFQFSGLSVEANLAKEKSFVERPAAISVSTLIRIGDEPYFVRIEDGKSSIFLVAGGEPADLDENVTRGRRALESFCGIVPVMMFLRGTLKEKLWHNDHPRACFIIDDPLLKRRHGFLEFKSLSESLRRYKSSACIAFIPWNYRRSNKTIAALFSSNSESLFLCVHGCDHTGAEFQSRDTDLLRAKAELALERMRKHRQFSGVPFDEVMVFPQGLFSSEALEALNAAGYLAAVNTDVSPPTTSESLQLRDLLDVAVTRWANFPLFGRRYPKDLAEFGLDLFLGKPVLVVEHHGYFKHGYESLETFIQQLNALDKRIEWTSLDTLCSHACLTRRSESGDVYVRFYTNRFSFQNTGDRKQRYILQPTGISNDAKARISVDGSEWSSQTESGELDICLDLDPGQTAQVTILPKLPRPGKTAWKPTITHNTGVGLRRVLCEVRDNYLAG